MPYLIDGHNLIAALPDIDLADENDEAKLLIKLKGFSARKKTRLTVIFDGGLPGGASALSSHSVKVVFAAAERSSADALIKGRIDNTRDARNWTLVSSDRELRDHARWKGMRNMSAAEFAELLRTNDRSQPVGAEPEKPSPSEDDTALWLKHFGEHESEDRDARLDP
ncbi:MAG: NYN domain-containing protein [Chloroflexi bacterium]|nr:NYN domain-containing protein [Chloroflexota bacterium]